MIPAINELKTVGITTCTVTRVILDVAIMAFGTIGIVNGVRGWRASGSSLRWTSFNSPVESKDIGNIFHYDKMNGSTGKYGPSQLQEMYPNTRFKFAARGQAGPDVEYIGGMHPSQYRGSNWESGFNYGDFKPDTVSGAITFYRDLNSGKLPPDTMPLPYDPEKLVLKRLFYFGP